MERRHFIQRPQHCRCVAAPATESRAGGDVLFEVERDAEDPVGVLLQRAHRLDDEIVLACGQLGIRAAQDHLVVVAPFQTHAVGETEFHHAGIDLVIAVLAFAEDTQPEIRLGGGGDLMGIAHVGKGFDHRHAQPIKPNIRPVLPFSRR